MWLAEHFLGLLWPNYFLCILLLQLFSSTLRTDTGLALKEQCRNISKQETEHPDSAFIGFGVFWKNHLRMSSKISSTHHMQHKNRPGGRTLLFSLPHTNHWNTRLRGNQTTLPFCFFLLTDRSSLDSILQDCFDRFKCNILLDCLLWW